MSSTESPKAMGFLGQFMVPAGDDGRRQRAAWLGAARHSEVLLTFSLTDPKERGIWDPPRGGHPLLTPLRQGRWPGTQRELPGATREDFTSRPRRSRPRGPRPRHLLLMLRSMGLRLAACTRTTTSLGNWMAGRAISLLKRSTSLRP